MRNLLALLLCLLALDASAASFPCAKAKSKVEKLICADAKLSKLDEELAAIFKPLSESQPGDAVANDQRDWLRQVRDQCADAACLGQAYRARASELRHWHDPVTWSEDQMVGMYEEPRRVLFFNESGGELEGATDCLSIGRAKDGSLEFRIASVQINGHMCNVEGKLRKEGEGYRKLPGEDDACELRLKAERGALVIEDPEHACSQWCGARASVERLSFRHALRKPGRCKLAPES
jgi:uncharacterized protein YecT (DUF1311 family)